MKERILFLCTHNASRSQMAEGIVNAWYGDAYKALSAGTAPTHVNPYVMTAMKEIGIDISAHRAKSINEFKEQRFTYVITLCDNAKATCPFFPGDHIRHKNFADPSRFRGSEEEILAQVRRVRDEIQAWLSDLLTSHHPEK